MNVPRTAANVEYLVFDITAGSSDVSISEVVLQRVDLGSRDDFDKVWLSRDGVVVSTSKTIASDDTVTIPLNLTVKAGSTETLTVNASMKATGTKINAFQVIDVKSSANLKLSNLRGSSMTTVDYTVAQVTLNPKATGGSTVDVGSENKILGEFTLEETATASKKNAIVKSIRFRTTGSVDLTTDLANLALYNDGSKISTETVIDGKNVTFKLPNVVIEDAKFKYYEIKADIVSGDDADTIAFSVKDDFDIYALEEGTGIGASIVKGTTLGTYALNAGKITISQDTTTPSSTEYIADTKNVLAFVAKVDLDQPVTVDALRLFVDASSVVKKTTSGTADNTYDSLDQSIENVKLVVNDRVIDTVDKITSAANSARTAAIVHANDYYNFDSSFELKDNDLIKVYVDITKDAVALTKLKFTINNTGLAGTAGSSNSLRDVEYVTSGELVSTTALNNKLTGTATSNTVEVTSSAAGASMTRNDGLSSEVFLAGTKGASLMKFVVNSGNSSALEIRKLNFDFAAAGFVSTDLTNVKLLKNGSQVGSTEDVSSNSVTIESINDIIAKNSQVTYELVADINTSATSTAIAVTLDASDSVFFDSNKNGITTLASVTGDTSIVGPNALLTVAVDGDTPSEAIILADTTNVEVAKYKFTANDGIVDIKDLYFENIATSADDSRISALKLVVNGKTVDSRVPSSKQVRFNLGSANKIQVPKNGNLVVSVVADLNRITAAGQTNKAIKLELTDIVADTNATSKALTVVNGGTAIDNGTHYNGAGGSALAALNIQSEELTIRKTQPQIAVQTLGTSKLVAGEQTIFKFTVTADSKADVDVAAIDFNVALQSTAGTIGTYKLFVNGSDKTSDGVFTATRFQFTVGKDQVVSAGSSKTFELKATIGGTIATNDYVSVKIAEDTAAQAGDFATVNGTANKIFIWSDNAGSPHDRNTTDWFNGYNVKGLDTTTTTLTN